MLAEINPESGSGPSAPAVGADGAAYLEVHSETRVWNYEPCGNGSGAERLSVELLRIGWNGDVSSQVLQAVDRALRVDVSHYELVVGQVLPDEGGGVLATWFVDRSDAESQHAAAYLQGSGVTTYALPAGAAVAMVGADGVGLLSSSDGLAAFDLASGGVRWSVAIWGQPVAALADGGAGPAVEPESTALWIRQTGRSRTGSGPFTNCEVYERRASPMTRGSPAWRGGEGGLHHRRRAIFDRFFGC